MSGEKHCSHVALLYSLVQMLYWSSGFIAVGFAAAYLNEYGLAKTVVGFVCSGAALGGFVCAFLVSALIDRKGIRWGYYVVFALIILQLLTIPAITDGGKRYIAYFYVMYAGIAHALGTLLAKIYIDLCRQGHRIDFGIARGLGSLAYAVSATIAGVIVQNYNAAIIHWLNSILYLLLLILVVMLYRFSAASVPRIEKQRPAENSKTAPVPNLTRRKKPIAFLFVVLGVAMVSAANTSFSTFLVYVVDQIGGKMQDFTSIIAYLALVEIPVMFLFSKIERRLPVSSMLLLSLLMFCLKLGAAAMATNTAVLFVALSVQAFAAGLFRPSVVEFVKENASYKNSGKCQALMDGIPHLLTFTSAGLLGGVMDSYGVGSMRFAVFLMALCGTALSYWVLKRYFIRNKQ